MSEYPEIDAVLAGESEGCIVHGDCLEIMAGMPDNSVDAVVTDPPYGIADAAMKLGYRTDDRRGDDNTWHPESDWDKSLNPQWGDVCRVSELVAWFGHWRKRIEVEGIMSHPIRAEIVWAKSCHAGPPCPLAMRDERIWLFSSKGIQGKVFETSVWDEAIIPTWDYKHHKNQKPLSLMVRLLTFLPCETIVDPFCGSGTTCVAAKKRGKRYIGIDISERYCEIARNRIRDTERPLFT